MYGECGDLAVLLSLGCTSPLPGAVSDSLLILCSIVFFTLCTIYLTHYEILSSAYIFVIFRSCLLISQHHRCKSHILTQYAGMSLTKPSELVGPGVQDISGRDVEKQVDISCSFSCPDIAPSLGIICIILVAVPGW